MVFDLLMYNNKSLLKDKLEKRKSALEVVIKPEKGVVELLEYKTCTTTDESI